MKDNNKKIQLDARKANKKFRNNNKTVKKVRNQPFTLRLCRWF